MKFTESTVEDVSQIREWAELDPYHYLENHPSWWLTGNGLLAFCLQDDVGPVCYVRVDGEGELVRLHTQFAPRDAVSKRRLVFGMAWALKRLIDHFQLDHRGIIYNSVNPSLIQFMSRFGFKKAKTRDDYTLDFNRG